MRALARVTQVNEHLMQQVAEGQIRLEDIEAELTLKREELKGLVEAHAQLEQQNRELHERLLEKDDSDDVLLPKEAGEWERKQRELRRELENITCVLRVAMRALARADADGVWRAQGRRQDRRCAVCEERPGRHRAAGEGGRA